MGAHPLPLHIRPPRVGAGSTSLDWIGRLESLDWLRCPQHVWPQNQKLRGAQGNSCRNEILQNTVIYIWNCYVCLNCYVCEYLHWMVTPWTGPRWSFCHCISGVWSRARLMVTMVTNVCSVLHQVPGTVVSALCVVLPATQGRGCCYSSSFTAGTERFSNLPKVTQLISRARIQIRHGWKYYTTGPLSGGHWFLTCWMNEWVTLNEQWPFCGRAEVEKGGKKFIRRLKRYSTHLNVGTEL